MQQINFAKKYLKIVSIFYFLVSILIAGLILRQSLIANSGVLTEISCEVREGAMLTATQLMAEGKNPYDSKYLPMYYNPYGNLYNIMAAPLVKTGLDTVIAHRGISAVCLILLFIAFVFFCSLPKFSVQKIAAASVLGAVLHCQFVSSLAVCARPDALGLLLFYLSLFIYPFVGFSFFGACVAVVLGLLASACKLYFGISVVVIGLYHLFFEKKRRQAVILLISPIIFYGILALINLNYFTSTILIWITGVSFEDKILKKQILGDLFSYKFELLLFGIALVAGLWKKGFHHKPLRFWYLAITILFAVWFKVLGGHSGSQFEYQKQLLYPALLIVMLLSLDWLSGKLKPILQTLILIFAIQFFWNLQLSGPRLYSNNFYSGVVSYMKPFKEILAPAELVPILLEQKKTIYDNGATQFYLTGGANNHFQFLQKLQSEKAKFFIEYVAQICKKVKNSEFDLVVTDINGLFYWCLPRIKLEDYYKKQNIFPENCLRTCFEFWTPLSRPSQSGDQ